MKYHLNIKVGFTLAEVLITLGVIGVVAALTLPALIANYQKQVLKEQFKVAYSLMQQAWRKAEVDFGSKPECYYWLKNPYKSVCAETDQYGVCKKWTLEDGSPLPSGYSGNFSACTSFMNYVVDNLQIVKICNGNALSNGCIPAYKGYDTVQQANSPDGSMSDDEATSISGGCANWRENEIRNKRTVYVLKNGIILFPYAGPQLFAMDVNGMKGPNKWGYDLFAFQTKSDIKSPLFITAGGCMAAEKGGYTTAEMLSALYK